MAKKLLTLSTEYEHDLVTIDGEDYDLCVIDEISLDEFMWIARGVNKVQKTINSAKTKRADAKKVLELLDEITAKVIKAPPEVLAKLGDLAKLAIITAFFNQATKEEGSPIEKKTSSQPDSKDSTEELQKTG